MNRSTKKSLTAMVAILIVLIVVIVVLALTDKKDVPDDQMGKTVIGEMTDAAGSTEPVSAVEPETTTEAEPASVDLPNEKEVRLYAGGGGVMNLVTVSDSVWDPSVDIGTFEAINSTEDVIYYDNYYMLHQDYWDAVTTDTDYKIGYELSFDVDGENRVYTILSPSDIENNPDLFMGDADGGDVTGYMGVWVYYDMHQEGTYIHLTSADMAPGVLMTSIKLRPTPLYQSVSNCRLKVFSYSSDEEFNSQGRYIGTHGYEIAVNNQ